MLEHFVKKKKNEKVQKQTRTDTDTKNIQGHTKQD